MRQQIIAITDLKPIPRPHQANCGSTPDKL